jgi:predicted RNase H-like HicB family nuclease
LLEFDDEADAWVTYVPALDHISTFGASREEALENTKELIKGYIEAAAKEGLSFSAGSHESELVELEITIE